MSAVKEDQQIAILGFGNPVRADDGVGVYVAQQLLEVFEKNEQIEVFDMGTAAFEVLFRLKGRDKIILVDAVINAEEPVGSIFKLPAEAVEAEVEDDPMVFLHGLKWHQALSYARKMLQEDYPKEVEVYLIAIEDTRFNVGMSEVAKQAADRVVDLLKKELRTSSEVTS